MDFKSAQCNELLKYSVYDTNYKHVINVVPLNDVLLYNVPLAIQLELL